MKHPLRAEGGTQREKECGMNTAREMGGRWSHVERAKDTRHTEVEFGLGTVQQGNAGRQRLSEDHHNESP